MDWVTEELSGEKDESDYDEDDEEEALLYIRSSAALYLRMFAGWMDAEVPKMAEEASDT